jgi:hypothetical protein
MASVMTSTLVKPPIHVNYYLAPTNEVEKRIANIKDYYYMQGLKAQVRKQAIDNDDDRMLLITSLFKVDVDEEAIGALFTTL